MQFTKYIRLEFLVLLVSVFWLIFLFLFNPHYVELTVTLETWFPYKGLIYYKDFAAFHFPLGRLILYPIHLITDWNLEVDPFVGLFVGILNLLIIYLFGRRYLSKFSLSFSLIFFSLFFWYAATGILYFHEMLIGLGLTILIFMILKQITSQNTSPLLNFSTGLLISFIELTGQIATITLAFIFIAQISINFYSKNFLKNILFLIYGLLIPIIFISGYFYLNGALWHFFEYNITYYLLYAGYQKSLLTDLPPGELFIYYLPTIFYLILFLLNLTGKLKFNLQNYFILTLSLTTIPFILFSLYHLHHLNYSLPIQALLFGSALNLLTRKMDNWIPLLTITLFIFLFLSYITIIRWHFERIVLPPDFTIKNDIYPNSTDPMNDAINWILKNTSPNSKIMVVGDAMFYMRSNRLPASRPSKGIPYAWNPFERVKTEITNNPADYWIIERQFYKKLVTIYKQEEMQIFVDELLSSYKLVKKYDTWEIWEKI